MIRGQVVAVDGTPLVGVNVSFLQHPEYGYTISRQDGRSAPCVSPCSALGCVGKATCQPLFVCRVSMDIPWTSQPSVWLICPLLWEHSWLELSAVKGPKKKEKKKTPKTELQQNYSDIQTPRVKMCQVCCNSVSLTLEYFHKSGFPGNILSSHFFVLVVKCESSRVY